MKNIRNLETLLAALAECGYAEGKVEVHETAQVLYDYVGKKRPDSAHVIIRRNHTGISASNDIGFRHNADGTYTAIVSEYDEGALKIGGLKFRAAVERAYLKLNKNKVVQTLLQTTIPKMKMRGLVPRHATLTTVRNEESRKTDYVLSY